MTPSEEAVARRARVQCERHGWMGGMAIWIQSYSEPPRWAAGASGEWSAPWRDRVGEDEDAIVRHENKYRTHEDADGDRRVVGPVPDDPATIGCFAAMARRVTGRPLYVVLSTEGTWDVCEAASYGHNEPVYGERGGEWIEAPTELEAWLAALEAAP